MTIQITGLCASVFTCLSFFSLLIEFIGRKSVSNISLRTALLFLIGLTFWLFYSIIKTDFPLIVTASVALFVSVFLLLYTRKKKNYINHIAIWVNDLEGIKNFYCDNFEASCGDKYINSKKGFSSYFITFSTGCRIELMHQSISENNTQNHFTISVGSRNNVDSMVKSLKTKGVKLVSPPRTTGDGYYEAVIKDPEGNLVEITI